MSISTDNSGVACCGNCGAHVVVACSAGCAEPDVQFRKDFIANLRGPSGRETPIGTHWKRKPVEKPPSICTYGKCIELRAQKKPGTRGRPPTRCEKHLKYMGQWRKPKVPGPRREGVV